MQQGGHEIKWNLKNMFVDRRGVDRIIAHASNIPQTRCTRKLFQANQPSNEATYSGNANHGTSNNNSHQHHQQQQTSKSRSGCFPPAWRISGESGGDKGVARRVP